jgi:hypothetical protein
MSQDDMPENKISKPHRFLCGNKYGKGRPLGSQNKESHVTRERILRDIQSIYLKAVRKEQLYVALQAKHYQAKIAGAFRTRKLPPITKLEEMNKDQLREFLEILAAKDPELRDPNKPLEEYHYPISD